VFEVNLREFNKRKARVYIFLQGRFIQEVFLGVRVELGGA